MQLTKGVSSCFSSQPVVVEFETFEDDDELAADEPGDESKEDDSGDAVDDEYATLLPWLV